MEDVKATFIKITVTKIVVLFLDVVLLYSIYKELYIASILTLSAMMILALNLFINLWEAINKERLECQQK